MSEIKKGADEKRRKYGPDYWRGRVPPGTQGTVVDVDGIGQLVMKWDNLTYMKRT